MALLAPMSNLIAAYARTHTFSNKKQEWHSCPAISKTRTTPSWNKQSTPECHVTMDLRPLPRNPLSKCLLTAIRDFRNNQIRRIHERPLTDCEQAATRGLFRTPQNFSSCQLLTRRAHLQIRTRIHKLSILSSSIITSGKPNYTNRRRNQAAKMNFERW